jgi:hypothetical protein
LSLSKEKQIELVILHKKQILSLTNQILEIISDSDKTHKYNACQELELRKLMNETISELTIIAGFCGSAERSWVDRMTNSVCIHNVEMSWFLSSLLTHWCTMANSITIDFNKTPFKFFGADLKLKISEFEAQVKGIVDKRETSTSN